MNDLQVQVTCCALPNGRKVEQGFLHIVVKHPSDLLLLVLKLVTFTFLLSAVWVYALILFFTS